MPPESFRGPLSGNMARRPASCRVSSRASQPFRQLTIDLRSGGGPQLNQQVGAEGDLLHAGKVENADLFWGIIGGGSETFGILPSFEFRLQPVRDVVGGMVFHRLENA
jgi:hypothetical protein